jgi:hypothetical protein
MPLNLKAEKERMEAEIEMKRQAIAIVIDTIEATEEVLAASEGGPERRKRISQEKQSACPV